MDPELLKFIAGAVHSGLVSASWIVLVVSLIAAGGGAFLGAYLKSKGEHLATKEDFDDLLQQIKVQTKATEEIKADVQRDLNAFSDVLERGREFAGFHRERIVKHLDEVINAYIDLYGIAQSVPLRTWLNSNTDLATEARFRSALSRLRAHFGALESLGVITDEVVGSFRQSDSLILSYWDDVLGEAALRTPEFRKEFPNHAEFSGQQYLRLWATFMDKIESLGNVVKGLSRSITLPQ